MAKQAFWFKIFSWFVFILFSCLLLSACFFVRPLILMRGEIARTENIRQCLRAVLPKFDNQPWDESFKVDGVEVFPARLDEKVSLPAELGLPEQGIQTVTVSALKGFAFQTPARDGEGRNAVWMGLNGEGSLTGFRPVNFRQSRVPENFTEKIDLKTRASRQMTEAVENGREFFEMRRNFFFAGAHQAQMSGETN